MVKTTNKIAGITATFKNVLEPAIASAAAALAPELMALAWKLSYQCPIMGTMREVENIPAPPIIERPSAPVSGRYSDTKPSIVGQKKQTPNAKTKAAAKAAGPLTMLNNISPIPANSEEKINMPFGLSR